MPKCEAPNLLAGTDRQDLVQMIVPKLGLEGVAADSTDSDSDESSEDHSPRLS